MSTITKSQLTTIHVLLGKIGKAKDKEYKEMLVQEFTNKKQTSTTKLSYFEANAMIKSLEALVPPSPKEIASDVMRKKILHYAHNMGYVLGDGRVDVSHVNNWCMQYGYLHKPLNDYTYEELPELVTQYQQVYKSYLKGIKK